MAAAIISGLVSKSFPKSQITVSEPWEVNRQKMSHLGVKTTTNNVEATQGANFIILAVKPQVAKSVCQELATAAFESENELPVLVSIAAGITAESIRGWTKSRSGKSLPVVRVMPNTPALLGEGASGLYAGEDVSGEQKELVTKLLKSVSRAVEWVDREEMLDVVTGLSGSGPVCCCPSISSVRRNTDVVNRPISSPWSNTWWQVQRNSDCPRNRPRDLPRKHASARVRCS